MIRKHSSVIQPTRELLSYFFNRIRIDPKISFNGTPCWLWTLKPVVTGGYARFKKNGLNIFAHVAACRMFSGPIPEDLSCDHLCKRPNCVNPCHIEYVTLKVNILRSNGPAAKNAVKTRCEFGHEFIPKNTYRNRGKRTCRTCQRLRDIANRRANGMRERELDRCYRGHMFTAENTILRKDGKKNCRTCKNATSKNRRRALAQTKPNRGYGNRTHCVQGHPFDEVNTFTRANGGRGCRTCRNASSKRTWARIPLDDPRRDKARAACRASYYKRKERISHT